MAQGNNVKPATRPILCVLVCCLALSINTLSFAAFIPSSRSLHHHHHHSSFSTTKEWESTAPNHEKDQRKKQNQNSLKMGLYDTPLPPSPSNDENNKNNNNKNDSSAESNQNKKSPQTVADTDWDDQLQKLQQRSDAAANEKREATQRKMAQEKKQKKDARALFQGRGGKMEDEWMPNMPKGPVEDEPWFTG